MGLGPSNLLYNREGIGILRVDMAICNMKPVAGQYQILSLRPCLEAPLGIKKGYVHAPGKGVAILSLDICVYIYVYIYKKNYTTSGYTTSLTKQKKSRTILEVIFSRIPFIHHIFPNIREETAETLQMFLLQDTNEIQSSRKTLRFSNGNSWASFHIFGCFWSIFWGRTKWFSSWWIQPIWKILVKMGIFPK